MIDWTNSLNLLLTFVNVIIAAILVSETIKLRRVETEPEIAVYLDQHSIRVGLVDLVIKNIGRGSAYDLVFEFNRESELLKRLPVKDINQFGFFEGIKFIAPGQEIRTLFAEDKLFNEPIPPALPITITYKGKDNKSHSEEFLINPKQFCGILQMHTDNINDINRSLKDISTSIKKLASR